MGQLAIPSYTKSVNIKFFCQSYCALALISVFSSLLNFLRCFFHKQSMLFLVLEWKQSSLDRNIVFQLNNIFLYTFYRLLFTNYCPQLTTDHLKLTFYCLLFVIPNEPKRSKVNPSIQEWTRLNQNEPKWTNVSPSEP